MIGRRKPQLTGLDVLIGMADTAERDGVPYANQYAALVSDLAPMPGPPIFVGQAIARGDLHEHEIAPVGVVRAAAEWAKEQRDLETLTEVAWLGARVATVWPRFLLSTPGGHPELRHKESDDVVDGDAVRVVSTVLADGGASDGQSFIDALDRLGFDVRRKD